MATLTANCAPDNTSDTTFRLWGSSVDNSFVSLGWIQASDTGQINWTTVTKPTIVNTSQGYSIFRMNDSLQSTQPVFIKMEYGSSSSTLLIPAFWITIGTGSDGSGNITGVLNSRQYIASYSSNTGNSICYFSGSSSRWCAALWTNHNSTLFYYNVLSIERTKDSTGALTSDGLMFFTTVSSSATSPTTTSHYMPFVGSIPAQYIAWNCCIPTTVTPASSGAYKNTVALYPIKCWTPGESGPSTNIFLYQTSDITSASATTDSGAITVTLFDGTVTSTILPLAFYSYNTTISTIATTNRGFVASVKIAMRYE
jgi:hypothetical protein